MDIEEYKRKNIVDTDATMFKVEEVTTYIDEWELTAEGRKLFYKDPSNKHERDYKNYLISRDVYRKNGLVILRPSSLMRHETGTIHKGIIIKSRY